MGYGAEGTPGTTSVFFGNPAAGRAGMARSQDREKAP
jgi:hypothetical protein